MSFWGNKGDGLHAQKRGDIMKNVAVVNRVNVDDNHRMVKATIKINL